MKELWSGFCVAFSLYSAIPMPQTDWTKHTMRYALAFLPIVGILVGALEAVWLYIAQLFALQGLLYSAIAVLLPMLLTGGIHLDGFTDTSDALASHADKDKRLEIMKDPHIGAFGVLYVVALLLLQLGLYAQFYVTSPQYMPMLWTGFALARIIGGGAIVSLPCAKGSGLAYLFAQGSDKQIVKVVLAIEMLSGLAVLVKFSMLYAVVLLIVLGLAVIAFRMFCMKKFGGITGDLAGFSITCAETIQLALCVILGLIRR